MDGPTSLCDDAEPELVTGKVTSGATDSLVKGPYELRGTVEAEVAITSVKVGDAYATSQTSNFATWSVALTQQDLEEKREGDLSRLAVVATDICGKDHPLDELELPIGPATPTLVTGLQLVVSVSNSDECYLPADGSGIGILRVTADPSSVGAAVTLAATHGAFVQGGTTLQSTLKLEGDMAVATESFVASEPGIAVFSASHTSAPADVKTRLVAGSPVITPSSAVIAPDVPYLVSVRSKGNLASCSVEATASDLVTVTIVDSELGVIDGSISFEGEQPPDCGESEVLSVAIQIAAGAPPGSSVTLRCFDTFAQEGVGTFSLP